MLCCVVPLPDTAHRPLLVALSSPSPLQVSLGLSALSFNAPALMPTSRMMAPSVPVTMAEKSQAMPFMDKPAALDGSMPGDYGFDPFGFSSGDISLSWMREAEIKHGRVCMLAIVGYIAVDLGFRAPGAPASITSFQAHDYAVSSGQMWVLLAFAGVFEIAGAAGIAATLQGDREPGDFALYPGATIPGNAPKDLTRLRTQEIVHCRLAMLAFSGLITQVALSGGDLKFPYY